MLPRNEINNQRIEGKAQLLEELDPNHEVQLDSTFTNHLANAIRASSPTERLKEIDKATEAYENAFGLFRLSKP